MACLLSARKKCVAALRRPQFGLASLLLAMTVISVLLGVKASSVSAKRKAIQVVRQRGGQVYFSYECKKDGRMLGAWDTDPEPVRRGLKGWMAECLGDEWVYDVATVNLSRTAVTDEDLKQVAVFQNLWCLQLSDTRIGDRGLSYLGPMKALKQLDLDGTCVTEPCILALRASHPGMDVYVSLEAYLNEFTAYIEERNQEGGKHESSLVVTITGGQTVVTDDQQPQEASGQGEPDDREEDSQIAAPGVMPSMDLSAVGAHEDAQCARQGQEYTTNSIGMTLVLVPAGEFLMGSSQSADEVAQTYMRYGDPQPDEFPGEQPMHRVRLTQSFYMGITHVTRGQFREFVESTGYKTDAEKDGKGGTGFTGEEFIVLPMYSWRNTGFEQTDEHPVVNVSWNDATAFCQWLSAKEAKTYSLPTEAQWEYACRAGTTTQYYYGDDPEALAQAGNVADASYRATFPYYADRTVRASDGYVFTSPGCRFPSNAWGLHDMHGNAIQWCKDWYDEDYYAKSSAEDPRGLGVGSSRVVRGSNWGCPPDVCRAAWRGHHSQEQSDCGIGFRVVVEF